MILHITTASEWERAQQRGELRPPSLDSEGFVHCSTGRQWRRPLRALFAGQRDLLLLGVDQARVGARVADEEAEAGGERFPHLHGPLPAEAVAAVARIPDERPTGFEPAPPAVARLARAARTGAPPGVDEWHHRGCTVTTDRSRLDVQRLHAWLSQEAYWSPGLPRDVLDAALEASVCLTLLSREGDLAGFARVVTDRATFAYLCDVVVVAAHRGSGHGTHLVTCALDHPDLLGCRAWFLGTRDAHGLYERFGFRRLDERWMTMGAAAATLYAPG